MVLALSLPLSFPARGQIVTTTFGVVVLSILVQGSATAIAAGRMVRRTKREGGAGVRDAEGAIAV